MIIPGCYKINSHFHMEEMVCCLQNCVLFIPPAYKIIDYSLSIKNNQKELFSTPIQYDNYSLAVCILY